LAALVAPLQIYILVKSRQIIEDSGLSLAPERYAIHTATAADDGLGWLRDRHHQIDCLILDASLVNDDIRQFFTINSVLVPIVVLTAQAELDSSPEQDLAIQDFTAAYHGAAVTLPIDQVGKIDTAIQQAIQQFLQLSVDSYPLPPSPPAGQLPIPDLLSAQQERLSDKLKARLGYLGVYYKRNPEHFLRNMSQADRDALLSQLKADYRKIILGYFANDPKLNQNIDTFVDQTFMADISVSYIVEIHMELMDEFSKQLKLEGRSEEILLDYRLTLIDVIAHLCEMYRRSIPREP
jgi:circadian clock protein KaiA